METSTIGAVSFLTSAGHMLSVCLPGRAGVITDSDDPLIDIQSLAADSADELRGRCYDE